MNLLVRVSNEFSEVTGRTEYILDIEYKKVGPGGRVLPSGGLVVKQVRQVPSSDRVQIPYLVNQPTEFEVYTGEVELKDTVDILADHRLKSRWTLRTRNTILDGNAIGESLYTDVQIEYLDGDQIRTIAEKIALLPSAEHSVNGDDTIDSWQLHDLENPRTYRLRTSDVPMAVPPLRRPILAPSDLGCSGYRVPFKFLAMTVEYAYPVMSWYPSGMRYATNNTVYLWACSPASSEDIPQERAFSAHGVSIRSSFYYPPLPKGLTAWELGGGNTAPLKRWDQTIIEGLTTEPIVLKGYYSQTFRPEHHNQFEHFLFEPRLEPGLSAGILDQLQDKGIRFIHMILDKDERSPQPVADHRIQLQRDSRRSGQQLNAIKRGSPTKRPAMEVSSFNVSRKSSTPDRASSHAHHCLGCEDLRSDTRRDVRRYASPAEQTHDQQNHKHNQEHEEQHLGDAGRRRSNSAKS